MSNSTVDTRFWKKVEKTEGCWLWTASLDGKGYGQLQVGTLAKPKMKRAHRISYELAHGEIPEGMVIDHLCRQTRCVNPEHLEAVTFQENLLRGNGGRLRTKCAKGHDFSPENTAIRGGKRKCKQCARDWAKAYKAKVKNV